MVELDRLIGHPDLEQDMQMLDQTRRARDEQRTSGLSSGEAR
ncbi:MAG: hypothetical protein QM619_08285 [Micropruina sp.]